MCFTVELSDVSATSKAELSRSRLRRIYELIPGTVKASFQLPVTQSVHLLSITRIFLVPMRLRDTPVPIPNTTVKTQAADGTMLETAWESRWAPDFWGCSSVGRAPALQAGGREFESLHLHPYRSCTVRAYSSAG